MKLFFIALFITGLVAGMCGADDRDPFNDKLSRESYSLGYQFGANLRTQEIQVDKEILLRAVRDSLEGRQPLMSPEEIRETMFDLRRKAMVMQDKRTRELAAKNREEGKKFLDANKIKEEVSTLPSGLQYKILRVGDGPRANANDIVKLNYRGTLINGTEFDTTYNSRGPAIIKVDDAIKGWAESLQLMKAGSKWQLFVPADLAYGDKQFGRIPPGSTLIFEIELLSLEDPSSLVGDFSGTSQEGSESTINK
ncbi:MAG TPA: FKBP-type peptidyl-prolyl cis-trans isomerase [Dissulfurispiraceae bacterium]|nr:FKBP-type peptidyl-prolyl cis-trans isomerase [Dissulfurispiraceae bacterium]